MNFDSYSNHQKPSGKGTYRPLSYHARRRRLELRRIRSVPHNFSSNEMRLRKINNKKDIISKGPKSEDHLVLMAREKRPKSYGHISVVGRRRELDEVVEVKLGFLERDGQIYDYFGIFNRYVGLSNSRIMPDVLAKIVEEESNQEMDWEKVMIKGFNILVAEVNKCCTTTTRGVRFTVVLVGKNEMVVASCGGSKVVFSHGRTALFDYYKPNKDAEMDRILVTSSPLEVKVRVVKRSDTDEFVILASDGLWDAIPSETACEVASKLCRNKNIMEEDDCESSGAEAAAAMMAELAMARGSRENISIIVVDLEVEKTLVSSLLI